MIRILDPKKGRTILLKLRPDDSIQPYRFKAYAEAVLQRFRKINEPFTVNETLELVPGTDWRTAHKYLGILEYNRLVNFTQGPPSPCYILACETPEEEFQAKAESTGGILAAVAYDFVKRWSLRRPLVADTLLYRLSRFMSRLGS